MGFRGWQKEQAAHWPQVGDPAGRASSKPGAPSWAFRQRATCC